MNIKQPQKDIRYILAVLVNFLFLFMFFWIAFLAGNSLVKSSPLIMFVLPIILYILYRLFIIQRWGDKQLPYALWNRILFIITAVFVFYFGYQLKVDLSWDWGALIRYASDYVLNGEIENKQYLARYPNNQCWLFCLVILFRGIHFLNPTATIEDFHAISIVLNCVMVVLTIFIIHRIAQMIWGHKKTFYISILILFCTPLYMYATFNYTDTSAMLVCVLMMYLFLKVERCNIYGRIICLALLGVLAAFSLHLKVTIFIVYIAMVISYLLRAKNLKKFLFSMLISVLMFSSCYVVIDREIQDVVDISSEMSNQYKFPLTHWIMMSLVYGGYVQEDVDFTKSFPTYEEKKEATIREIERRVEEKGLNGMLQHMCCNKIVRTWGDSTLAGSDYISRWPKDEDGIWQKLMMYNGEKHNMFKFFADLYYMLILIGLFFAGLGNVRKKIKDQPLLFGRITLIGITLFLMIWECNARYLVAFLPIIIMVAGDGYFSFYKLIQEKRAR